jgi:glycosyltransferase involved in cell wall biosynthesis
MHDSMSASRVALLLPCLLTGGTEVAALEMARALKSLEFAVEVIVYFDEVDPSMLEAYRSASVVVSLLGVRRESGLLGMRLAMNLQRTLRRGHFDIVWVQYMTPTLLPLLVSRFFTRNLISTVHVAASHYSSSGLARMRWLARHWCDRFICVSSTVAIGVFGPEGGAQRLGGRVVVLPNALDMATVRAAAPRDWRAEMAWPADVVVLGFAGRLAQIKGADILLNAVAQLLARGLSFRLVVVGDGAEMENLQVMARDLGIDAITHFAGRVPRALIYSAIKGFGIAAVPSREEGFGLSAIEAMAAGVPVVASRVDALQEVVLDGTTGLLCPAEDAGALAAGLARLVSDPGSRHAMGVAGAAHVARRYDTPAYRASMAELLAG